MTLAPRKFWNASTDPRIASQPPRTISGRDRVYGVFEYLFSAADAPDHATAHIHLFSMLFSHPATASLHVIG
jgi:hypothetical protein